MHPAQPGHVEASLAQRQGGQTEHGHPDHPAVPQGDPHADPPGNGVQAHDLRPSPVCFGTMPDSSRATVALNMLSPHDSTYPPWCTKTMPASPSAVTGSVMKAPSRWRCPRGSRQMTARK